MEFKLIREILSEKSPISCMRLMSLIALFLAGYIAVVGLQKGSDLSGLSMLVGTFLAASFGGKTFQKNIEVKSANSSVTSAEEQSTIPRP